MIMQETIAAAAPSEGGVGSLLEMLKAGGPIVVVLGILSVISLAFTVERFLRLSKGSVGGKRFGGELLDLLATRGPEAALEYCDTSNHSMARVLGSGLRRASFPLVERDKAVEDSGLREVRQLSANLRPMLVVSILSPLLGLLGTVWGMITAFRDLASSDGSPDPEVLASGISLALVTTAVGLAVAIPSQASYYWFKSRVDKFIRNVDFYYHEINEILVHGVQAQSVPSVQDESAAA